MDGAGDTESRPDRTVWLEKTLAKHIGECSELRRHTQDSLERIESLTQKISDALHQSNAQLLKHLVSHETARLAWSDIRVWIGMIFGVMGVLWGVFRP